MEKAADMLFPLVEICCNDGWASNRQTKGFRQPKINKTQKPSLCVCVPIYIQNSKVLCILPTDMQSSLFQLDAGNSPNLNLCVWTAWRGHGWSLQVCVRTSFFCVHTQLKRKEKPFVELGIGERKKEIQYKITHIITISQWGESLVLILYWILYKPDSYWDQPANNCGQVRCLIWLIVIPMVNYSTVNLLGSFCWLFRVSGREICLLPCRVQACFLILIRAPDH